MLHKTNTLLKTTLSIVLAMSLTACDDEDDKIISSSIEGTYKMIAFTTSIPLDYNNDGVETTNLIDESGCYDDSDITLLPNGTALFNIQSIDVEYTSDENGNPAAVVECLPGMVETASYTSTNSTVTFSLDGQTMDFNRNGNTIQFMVPGDDSFFGDVVLVFQKQ